VSPSNQAERVPTALVTGATGFVGSHVAHELGRRGYAVRAPVRPSSEVGRLGAEGTGIEWVPCDLVTASPPQLRALCQGVDLCIHAAWYVEPGRYLEAMENVAWSGASMRLLEALAAAGCRRAVYVGTCFEYDHQQGYLSETSDTLPRTLYAAAKLSTFLMGARLAERVDVAFSWARLFYLYGPHEHPGRLVPQVIQGLLSGADVAVTRGLQVRDFLHVADVAAALVDIAGSDHTGVVNVGSGHPVRVRDVVATIAETMGDGERIRFGARPEPAFDPPFICANNERLREMGWSPRFDLGTGLQDAVAFWRAAMDHDQQREQEIAG
jgi:nucleoside-diphosphate-sugar epimerase